MPHLSDVFTADEIAQAAGVPTSSVQRLVDTGDLRPLPGTAFFSASDAIRAGRLARRGPPVFSLKSPPMSQEGRGLSALASSIVHLVLLTTLFWSMSGTAETAAVGAPSHARLVFLTGPGPGGGGGGGGRAPKADVRRIATPRPAPAETATSEPEPLPSRKLIAPVALSTGDRNRAATEEDGEGPGVGPGLGSGTGGGAGGGPYRPGSGIEPPQLLREVKAQYTDEARRLGVAGDVILEVVIRRDGTVGDIKVLRGLGAGLDGRAEEAVRSWRFSPARRLGEPVDVIVEVAVEFSLH
jgi:TonB family protein